MISNLEIEKRILENDIHPLECTLDTSLLPLKKQRIANPLIMVKRFQRSAAGTQMKTDRNLEQLIITVDYLTNVLWKSEIGKIHSLPIKYAFVMDRLRAVSVDIVIQRYKCDRTLQCLYSIATFHVKLLCMCLKEGLQVPVFDIDMHMNTLNQSFESALQLCNSNSNNNNNSNSNRIHLVCKMLVLSLSGVNTIRTCMNNAFDITTTTTTTTSSDDEEKGILCDDSYLKSPSLSLGVYGKVALQNYAENPNISDNSNTSGSSDYSKIVGLLVSVITGRPRKVLVLLEQLVSTTVTTSTTPSSHVFMKTEDNIETSTTTLGPTITNNSNHNSSSTTLTIMPVLLLWWTVLPELRAWSLVIADRVGAAKASLSHHVLQRLLVSSMSHSCDTDESKNNSNGRIHFGLYCDENGCCRIKTSSNTSSFRWSNSHEQRQALWNVDRTSSTTEVNTGLSRMWQYVYHEI